MKNCFLCKRHLSNSDKSHDVFSLMRESISIPFGMNKNDLLCQECYLNLTNKYKPQPATEIKSNESGIEVRGVEFHDKALTPEETEALV